MSYGGWKGQEQFSSDTSVCIAMSKVVQSNEQGSAKQHSGIVEQLNDKQLRYENMRMGEAGYTRMEGKGVREQFESREHQYGAFQLSAATGICHLIDICQYSESE